MNVPASYLEGLAPVIRTFFTATMLYKERKPHAPRVHLLVDEAGQLQKAQFLQRAFTYGRGAGLATTALFQSVGQVLAHYGQAGLQDFMSSAGTRQFFCVRDYDTAKLVSNMLGMTTLEYDDTLKQEEARQRKRDLYRRLMEEDVDPWEAAEEIRHFDFAAHHRSKQARQLMTPDEVLAMPDDRQLLFISGHNLPPIYANRYAYWLRSEMAGFFLNNPFHGDPYGPVRIMTRRGPRMANVITCDPPREVRHLPQSAVPFRFVEGFCPI